MSNEWYTNKDLFEMIGQLTKQMAELKNEMHETTRIIREYNGLRRTMGELEQKLIRMETSERTSKESSKSWRDWIAWIIAVIMAVIALIK